ncbi:LPS export ABC transporter periplasmic protein LptC [Microbaculum marinum]|uniref:LPS export ABC transporter periplasmic protein LptC n=1 Tax=Microbaculum marinum TaxID=1764581 RepID=A0AAW9RAX0_9HYPH
MSINVRTLTGSWSFGPPSGSSSRLGEGSRRKFDASWRAARRHSRFVAVLRIALPAVSILVVASMFITMRTVSTSFGDIDLGEVGLQGTTLTMQNPKLSGFNENGTSYQVTAAKALQDVTNPRVVTLEQIDGTMTQPDGNDVHITARNGVYDADAQKLDLTEEIVVRTKNGENAYLNSAHVDMGAGLIRSEDPVEAETKSGRITANSMEITDRGSHLLFKGGVVVVLRLDGGKVRGASGGVAEAGDAGQGSETGTGTNGPDVDVTGAVGAAQNAN